MRMLAWVLIVAACSSSKTPPTSSPPPPPPQPVVADAAAPAVADATIPTVDAPAQATGGLDDLDDAITYTDPRGGSPGTVEANTVYRSDCSTTHPIARNPCSGVPFETRGLTSCKSLHVKTFKPCKKGAPSCYLEQKCPDGSVVPSDFLECSPEQSSRCFTKSSRIYKDDIAYLSDGELADLATQVEQLRLARYRYKDEPGKRVGFIIEDAPDAPWVTADGRRIDLYSLLSASIAAIQQQDARIRQLEHDIQSCKR